MNGKHNFPNNHLDNIRVRYAKDPSGEILTWVGDKEEDLTLTTRN